MPMGTERSQPLHNFTLPCLRWGSQKHLRCMKVESAAAAVDRRSPASRFADRRNRFARDSERRRTVKVSKSKIDADDGIEAVREKLMFDLKTAADRMKDAILRDGHVSGAAPAPSPAEDTRPWNLRTRRAACKAPLGGGETTAAVRVEVRKPSYSPSPTDGGCGATAKSPPLRPEFSVSLSRKEIEDDYLAMLGERPPRRPKKRPRNVQKQLDTLFPGLWLAEVSEDMYKVPDLPEPGKR